MADLHSLSRHRDKLAAKKLLLEAMNAVAALSSVSLNALCDATLADPSGRERPAEEVIEQIRDDLFDVKVSVKAARRGSAA